MTQIKPQDDLAQIRSIMERSTRFLSLSALASVLAGLYALIGAAAAYRYIYFSSKVLYGRITDDLLGPDTLPLVLMAAAVFILAAGTGLWLCSRKAHRAGQRLWTKSARRVLVNFSLPMLVGGIFILVLYWRGYYGLIAASTLIFYGMALISAGNFTFSDIRTLGLWQAALGLLAAVFPGKGLLFWALGFGVLHVVYGVVIYWKYERNTKDA
ncbi:MAG: hypothetical protein KF852_20105 [Saprospiraceae bacterium]|nr:hypothetical protein [Saprospiraceae bacterium]